MLSFTPASDKNKSTRSTLNTGHSGSRRCYCAWAPLIWQYDPLNWGIKGSWGIPTAISWTGPLDFLTLKILSSQNSWVRVLQKVPFVPWYFCSTSLCFRLCFLPAVSILSHRHLKGPTSDAILTGNANILKNWLYIYMMNVSTRSIFPYIIH